jgi:uncharacterized cupredoxin-like copper-binding protein
MDNQKSFAPNTKTLWILIGVLALIVVIALIALISTKNSVSNHGANNANPAVNNGSTASNSATNPSAGSAPETISTSTIPALQGATVVVPGANPIAKDNQVVTQQGVVAQNNVVPMSPQAPQQTAPISQAAVQNNKAVIKLSISAAGWVPNTFTTNAGAPTTIAVTGTDDFTHVFMFDDPSLSAVAIGISPHETRAITFNAPTKAGTYSFRCDVPGHAARGEVGKMIVK